MDTKACLDQILAWLDAQQAGNQLTHINIYIVETMMGGPGDARHLMIQTASLQSPASGSSIVQNLTTGLQNCQEKQLSDAQEHVEAKPMVGELAAAAGMYLVAKASGKLAENVGGEVGNRIVNLWDKVKAKLAGKGGGNALARLEAKPEDARRRGALELELEEAMEADPAFREEVAALVGELKEKGGDRIVQSATTIGDHNRTTQIVGSGNRDG